MIKDEFARKSLDAIAGDLTGENNNSFSLIPGQKTPYSQVEEVQK
jgi:hypothetical protein